MIRGKFNNHNDPAIPCYAAGDSSESNKEQSMSTHFDLIAIGAGSGGLSVAERAASYGAK